MSRRMRVVRWVGFLVTLAGLGLVAVGWWAAREGRATAEALAYVKPGMTVAQVEALFGAPAQVPSRSSVVGDGVAVNFVFDSFTGGASGRAAGKSFGAGLPPWAGASDKSWKVWTGRHGRNPHVAAVQFDGQGRAVLKLGYELPESGLLACIRRWLGL